MSCRVSSSDRHAYVDGNICCLTSRDLNCCLASGKVVASMELGGALLASCGEQYTMAEH